MSSWLKLLDRWDAAGHTTIDDLLIRAHCNAPATLPEGEWVINKRSAYTWTVSWANR